jgi:hypothetical protein
MVMYQMYSAGSQVGGYGGYGMVFEYRGIGQNKVATG